MLTKATTGRAKRPAKPITLVGVDVYIITENGIPQFDDYGAFKIEFVSNRGTKVWPGYVSEGLMLVNWYRCRFMATKTVTDADVDTFLAALSKKWKWSAAQKLWNYGDEAGFSKAY